MNYITSYCYIDNDKCTVNGETVAENNSTDHWLKSLYKSLDEKYPKFHKMDPLSQLAYLGTENILNSNKNIKAYGDDEIALLFCNKTSSLHTDLAYTASYKDGGTPSPSLFVYTLPNISIGEVAIKNKWYGENMFSILPEFDSKYFTQQPDILLNEDSKACLCGWIEMNADKMEAFLFFIEKKAANKLNLPLTEENIKRLYNEQNG